MGQNKEELNRLLDFIGTLTKQPGNEEFIAGLRALVCVTDHPDLKEELEDIRRILNIRGKQSIDYSFVDDDITRQQLIMDNLRMENAYLDNGLSIEDRWNEYCSYIHFQVENVLNYYYDNAFPDFDTAQRYIEKLTKGIQKPFKRDVTLSNSSQITTYVKTAAFCNDFFPYNTLKPDYTSKNLNQIRTVRNEYIHRSTANTVRDLQKNTTLGALKTPLVNLVNCVRSLFISKSFIEIVPAVVEKKLAGCATIKFNGKIEMLDSDTFAKYSKDLFEGKQLKAIVRNNVLIDTIIDA